MLSKDPADYRTFVKPTRPTPIETIADEHLMRGDERNPAGISWAAIRGIASNPDNLMCLRSGLHGRHIGHDLTSEWKAIKMSKLEQRVAGRVAERMAYMEFARDEFLTDTDARMLWHQEACRESQSRRHRYGDVRGTMPVEMYDLLRRVGHQAYDAILHIGTPLIMSDGDDDSLWSCRLGRVSDVCSGGIIDAICVGGQQWHHVVVDIKCTDHSVMPMAGQWNAKNQAQLLMYFVALSRVAMWTDEVVAPRGIAFANPLRGVIEWAGASDLLANMDVLKNLGERGLWLHPDEVERVMAFISETLSE